MVDCLAQTKLFCTFTPHPGHYIKLVVVYFISQLFFFIDVYSLQRDFAAWQMNVEHSQVLFQTEDQFQSQYKCLLFFFNIVWKFQFACCSRKDLKRGKYYCVMKKEKISKEPSLGRMAALDLHITA